MEQRALSAKAAGASQVALVASQVALVARSLPAGAGDVRDAGLTPGWGRCPGGGRGNPLQDSCLANSMDREPGGLQSVGLQRVGHDSDAVSTIALRPWFLNSSPH